MRKSTARKPANAQSTPHGLQAASILQAIAAPIGLAIFRE
jgi:hypothetical protein